MVIPFHTGKQPARVRGDSRASTEMAKVYIDLSVLNYELASYYFSAGLHAWFYAEAPDRRREPTTI